jgi:16S rRNA (uracil1498-N3)-methyltransferase
MPRKHRFIISPDEDIIDIDSKIITIHKQSLIHKINKVLKLNTPAKANQTIEVFDGKKDKIFETQLVTGEGSSASTVKLQINDIRKSKNELKQNIRFFIPVIKTENFEIMVRKLCELGAKHIIPVSFERSQKKHYRKLNQNSQLTRLEKIIESAIEQCEGAIFPCMDTIVNFTEVVEMLQQESSKMTEKHLKVFASEKICTKEDFSEEMKILEQAQRSEFIDLLVGPEGGLSDAECKLALDQGFKEFSLGRRILRAETAAISLFSKLYFI